jgi:SET domain-containing protein
MSYIYCDSKSCPCGEHCSNLPFHRIKPPPLETFLTENRGYGVRAKAPIKKGAQQQQQQQQQQRRQQQQQQPARRPPALC